MWSSPGTILHITGITQLFAKPYIACLRSIIESHLLPTETDIDFYIEEKDTYGRGSQVFMKVVFPSTVPDFLVNLGRSRWSVWPSVKGQDGKEGANLENGPILFVQTTGKCVSSPEEHGLREVMLEDVR